MKTSIVSFKSIIDPTAIHRLDAPVHMTEGGYEKTYSTITLSNANDR